MEKCNVKALALSLGIIWGAAMMLVGWLSMYGYGTQLMQVFASIYIGYEASWLGGIIGGIWGFIDGAIGGLLVALLYNKFNK